MPIVKKSFGRGKEDPPGSVKKAKCMRRKRGDVKVAKAKVIGDGPKSLECMQQIAAKSLQVVKRSVLGVACGASQRSAVEEAMTKNM